MFRKLLVFALFLLILSPLTGSLSAAGKGPIKPPAKPAPAPVITPLPPVPGKPALPDLVVANIRLHNNNLIIEIKNAGPGAIPDSSFSASSVRIEFDSKVEEFFLGMPNKGNPALDPARRLKNPGGSVNFDTGIVLDKPTEVIVTVDANQKITETDEGRANSKTASLSPRVVPQVFPNLQPKPPLPSQPAAGVKVLPAQIPQSPASNIPFATSDPDFGAPFTVESVKIVDVPHGNLIPAEKLGQTFRIRLRLKSTSTVPNRASISAKWIVQLKLEGEASRPLTLSQALQISLMPGQKDYFIPFQPRNIPDLGFAPRFVDLRYTFIDIQAPPPGPTPPDGSQNTPPPPPNSPGPTVSMPAGTQAPSALIAREIARLNNAPWGERQNVFKAALAVPQISFIMPNPGARQARITVKGTQFGQQRSDVKLALQKQGASAFIEPQIYSWKNDTIEFKAPDVNGIFSVGIYDRLFQSGSNPVSFSIADYIDIPAYPSTFLTHMDLKNQSGDFTNRMILAPLTLPQDMLTLTPVFSAPINYGWTRLLATTASRSKKWCYEYPRGYLIEVNGKLGLGDCSHFADPGWAQIEVPRAELGYDIKAEYGLTLNGHSMEIKYMSSGFSVQIPYNGWVHPKIYLVDTVNHQRWTTVHLTDGKFEGHLSILIKVKVADRKITVEDITCAISGDMNYLPELNAAWSQTKGPLVQYLSQQLMNRKKALEDSLTEKITTALGPLKIVHKLEFLADNKIRVYYSDATLNLTPQTSTPVIPAPAAAPSN